MKSKIRTGRGKESKPAKHDIHQLRINDTNLPSIPTNVSKADNEAIDPPTKNVPNYQNPAYARLIAESEARSFRAMNRPVYPGVMLVLRDGSAKTFPTEDDKFDPTCERPFGIAYWGAKKRSEEGPGVLSVMEDGEDKLAMIACHDDTRPLTGVGRVDAWIVRADSLRRMRLGVAFAPGHEQLSAERWRAAIAEVEHHARKNAVALINQVPDAKHLTLRALARVADTQVPSAQELTDAIQELMVSAQSWNSRITASSVTWIRSDQAATMSGLSTDTFLKKAKKEHWETKPEGKYLCFKESDLINAWPTYFQP